MYVLPLSQSVPFVALTGGQNTADIRQMLVNHILAIKPRPQHWPDFSIVRYMHNYSKSITS